MVAHRNRSNYLGTAMRISARNQIKGTIVEVKGATVVKASDGMIAVN